jgi:hypothetical protein
LALVAEVVLVTPGVASAATYSSSTSFHLNPLVALISAVLFAFLCGWIAKTKGRSVALWAVLGIFFGLISLIIIALLKKKQPTTMMNTMSPPPPPTFNPPPPAIPPTPPPN